MLLADLAAEVFETCFRLFPFPTKTGLRIIGRPGPHSPVFLTGNYDLTVRRVLRALRDLDAYLIVCPSGGINVWCAASGGHLSTHQVVTALKLARLEERVSHRQVILPQLAATGVERREVRHRTGWLVRFGPVYARDIRAYLEAGKQKSEGMRRVRFGARERFEMAIAWATPISLVLAAVVRAHLIALASFVFLLALIVFFLYDRLPGSEWQRRATLGILAALCGGAIGVWGEARGLWPTLAWSLGGASVVALLTFDYAGSSPTDASGLFEEKNFRVELDLDRCRGVYSCWEVCPESCFEKKPEQRKVAIAHGERCIRCGACIVQCPEDALEFRTTSGLRVSPQDVRRFKLNLLGKRARRIAPHG